MKTVPFSNYVRERVARDPEFRNAMVQGAIESMMDGETEVGLEMLRDVVKAQSGFHDLALRTGLNEKSLYRALSPHGNPTIKTLAKVRRALVGA